MNRFVGVLLSLWLVAAAVVADAHGMAVVSKLSFQAPDTVVVQLRDLYSGPVTGVKVTAATGQPGEKLGRAQDLKEEPPGTYTGRISHTPDTATELTVEATVAQELFRTKLPIDRFKETPEVEQPMEPIDVDQGFSWSPYLFGAAVIALISLTVAARLKARQGEPPTEDPSPGEP